MRPTNINRSREVHCLDSCISSFFILVQSALIEIESKKGEALILFSLKYCSTWRAYIQCEVLAELRRHI